MLYCPGEGCPLRGDCCHHTQPARGRDAFAALPYDALTGTCAHFVSNEPSETLIRTTAYYLWLRSGCRAGCAQENWNEAYISLCRSAGRDIEVHD